MIHAPFDATQIAALREWQECAWAEPIKCAVCHTALPMIPEKKGMMCPNCYTLQEAVPAECFNLPPEPTEAQNAND